MVGLLPETLKVPLLNDLAPDGFFYGGTYIVEFDPDSLWYETSLSIAALALRQGMKTAYHVFQHAPSEAVEAFKRLGLDAEKLQDDGLLDIWDSYTVTVDYEAAIRDKKGDELNTWKSSHDKPFDLEKTTASVKEHFKAGYTDKEKRWLHLDDNTAVQLQYSDEEEYVNGWRTVGIPYYIRPSECPHFLAYVKGVASDAFYTKYEAMCDGIIDVKAKEESGRMESYIRVRMLRGKNFDSSWHRLLLVGNGEVRLVGASPRGEQRRLAAIMFTDMVGYTALGQRNESLSLALVEEQRKLIRPILGRHNGREVKTIGDAFLVEFPNAVDAVRCAYDIQRAVREFNFSLEPEKRIHLRVGVHVGEVVESQGDISGDAVNVASRIEPLAEDGGVCLTRQVYDFVRNNVDIPLSSLGLKPLKNVAEPIEVYKMAMPWEKNVASPEAPVAIIAPAPDKNRVAVLPFANMSPDPADEYFADGMTEELIDRLAHVKQLKVIARTSVMSYKGEKKKASQIAKELDAGGLVEGSVRKAGNKIRVTVQLINGGTEEHLWSEHYDGSLDDIFAVQSEIAEKVAGELKVQLLESDKKTLEKKPTEDTVAYTYYLRGLQLLNQLGQEPLRNALSLFEQAVARDPSFARAYAGMVDCYVWLASRGYIPFQEGIDKGRATVQKALELDPGLAEGHYALSRVMSMADDDQGSLRELGKALELNPNLAAAYVQLADESAVLGDTQEMVRAADKAYQLDPLSPSAISWVGMAYYWTGRGEEAMEHWKKTLHLEPYRTYRSMFDYYVSRGEYTEAESTVKELERLGPTLTFTYLNRGYLAALTGDEKTAREMIAKLDPGKGAGWSDAAFAGLIYYAMGDMDRFFEYMMGAAENHTFPAATIRLSPLFEKARKDSRMAEVFRRTGLQFEPKR